MGECGGDSVDSPAREETLEREYSSGGDVPYYDARTEAVVSSGGVSLCVRLVLPNRYQALVSDPPTFHVICFLWGCRDLSVSEWFVSHFYNIDGAGCRDRRVDECSGLLGADVY